MFGTTHLLADISGYFTSGATLSADAVRPGGKVTVRARGFAPSSDVRVELHSDPVLLETPTASAEGAVELEVTIPEDTPAGDHEIVVAGVDPDLVEIEFRTPVSVDRDGPEIPDVTVSPTSASIGDEVIISVRATDPADVESVGFYFMLNDAQRDICGQQLEFASGTVLDGVWSTSCTIPSDAQNGVYEVVPFAEDGVGNFTNTNCCSTSSTRGALTVTGGSDDSDGPSITVVTVSPATAAPGDVITISVSAADESGVVSAGFYLMLGDAQRDICGQTTELTSGDEFVGVWSYECTIPDLVQNGTYTVVPLGEDTVGNYTNTNCCTSDDTRGSFTVSGGSDDSDGPGFTSVTVSESSVGPGDTFTISIAASDASGVSSVGFYFMLGDAQRDFCGQSTTLASGDEFEGVWTHDCVVPDEVQGGTYSVVPYAMDVFGNYTNTNCCTLDATRGSFTVE